MMMLIRTGGGHAGAPVDPARHASSTSPGTAPRRSTPPTPTAAPALAIRDRRALPGHPGQPRAADQLHELPAARRRDGRRRPTPAAASSRSSTAASATAASRCACSRAPTTSTARRRSRSRAPATTSATPTRPTSRASCASRSCCSTMKSQILSLVGLHPPAVDRLGAAADDRDRHGRARRSPACSRRWRSTATRTRRCSSRPAPRYAARRRGRADDHPGGQGGRRRAVPGLLSGAQDAVDGAVCLGLAADFSDFARLRRAIRRIPSSRSSSSSSSLAPSDDDDESRTRSRPSRAGGSWCRSRCCRSRCP